MGGMFGGGSPKADNSAAMAQIEQSRAETEKLRMKAEQDKRDLQEAMAAKKSASRRGGSRMLLSDTRLTPETGIPLDETLGA
jgi:hypothetical protein